jgi:hypothetical protein
MRVRQGRYVRTGHVSVREIPLKCAVQRALTSIPTSQTAAVVTMRVRQGRYARTGHVSVREIPLKCAVQRALTPRPMS